MPGNQKPRQRKHRGTQTGSITRAQRSRPRTRQEAMAQARSRSAKGKQPVDRRDLPPTWGGAILRAAIIAAILFPVSLLLMDQTAGGALVLSLVAFVFYVPLGYYLEQFLYRRRQAKLQKERAARAAEKSRR
jgi:Flp pilus assembly protein TadB